MLDDGDGVDVDDPVLSSEALEVAHTEAEQQDGWAEPAPAERADEEPPEGASAEAEEDEDRAVDDVAIAQRATIARRAHDIRVVAQEMAFHLVKQTLLLFGEWHASPSLRSFPADSSCAVDH